VRQPGASRPNRCLGVVAEVVGHASITITLDIYTHLFEDARHAHDIRARMAASPFAGLLEPTAAAPGATVLQLRLLPYS